MSKIIKDPKNTQLDISSELDCILGKHLFGPVIISRFRSISPKYEQAEEVTEILCHRCGRAASPIQRKLWQQRFSRTGDIDDYVSNIKIVQGNPVEYPYRDPDYPAGYFF